MIQFGVLEADTNRFDQTNRRCILKSQSTISIFIFHFVHRRLRRSFQELLEPNYHLVDWRVRHWIDLRVSRTERKEGTALYVQVRCTFADVLHLHCCVVNMDTDLARFTPRRKRSRQICPSLHAPGFCILCDTQDFASISLRS